jgi:ATP-binding cassette subfamily C protein CydC
VAGLRRGDLLARVGADVDTLADLVVRSLLPFAVALTTATASAVLVATLLPPAGLVVAAGLAVAALGAPPLAALAARRAERDAAQARTELSAEVLALFDGLGELTVAGAMPARLAQLTALDGALASRLDRAAGPAAAATTLSTTATGLAMAAALLLGVRALDAGQLAPVLLAVVTLTPLAAAEAVIALPAAATGLVKARAAAERVLALLDAGELSTEQDAGELVAEQDAGELVAERLSCGWPGAEPTLTGIDLTLTAGRRVAVVGASGCGKTTLLLTLAGLLPPVAGRIRLGDLDLADRGPAVVRRTVSFTAESAHIFTTTVRENLRVADPGADDAAVVDALARAGLGHWPAALPNGLDTMLGSGGTGLSGGERRRLLLARAGLVGARVLLLDEPAEHLDPRTADALVRDVLTRRPADAELSVVVVTHRLTPLDAADEVLLLDGGTLIARGTQDWLLKRNLTYRDVWLAERGTQGITPGSGQLARPEDDGLIRESDGPHRGVDCSSAPEPAAPVPPVDHRLLGASSASPTAWNSNRRCGASYRPHAT